MEDHTSHVWNAFCEFDVDMVRVACAVNALWAACVYVWCGLGLQDGRITVEELAQALQEPIDLIKAYIAEYDLNHDGTVDFKVRSEALRMFDKRTFQLNRFPTIVLCVGVYGNVIAGPA
jgi:hypothetical protein